MTVRNFPSHGIGPVSCYCLSSIMKIYFPCELKLNIIIDNEGR